MISTKPIQMVLDKLNSNGLKVKETGNSQWQAQCPAHDDQNPSLSIKQLNDGTILLRCFAGCSTDKICDSLSLSVPDLFPNQAKSSNKEKSKPDFSESNIEATYDYTDEKDNLLYQVVRYNDKRFLQRKPNGNGGWAYKLNGVQRVPYQLPQILKANHEQWLFWVEGEKDVDHLTTLDLVATTTSQGAGNWQDEYAHYFSKRMIAVLPDNDEQGQEYGYKVAVALSEDDRNLVKIINLDGLPEKGDVSDWLDNGGTKDELLRLVNEAEIFCVDDESILENHTDVGNAGRFASQSEGQLKWCWDKKAWLYYDGKRWCDREGTAYAYRKAIEVARSIPAEAEYSGSPPLNKIIKWSESSESDAQCRKSFSLNFSIFRLFRCRVVLYKLSKRRSRFENKRTHTA